MQNQTIYRYDALLKMNVAHAAKARKKCLLYALLTAALGITFVVVDLLSDSLFTAVAGVIFLTLSAASFSILFYGRKSKLAKAVAKQVQDNPNKVITYTFETDALRIHQTGDNMQSDTRLNYCYIATAQKIDDTLMYFVTKNNLFYLLCDAQGVDNYFSYLCEMAGLSIKR